MYSAIRDGFPDSKSFAPHQQSSPMLILDVETLVSPLAVVILHSPIEAHNDRGKNDPGARRDFPSLRRCFIFETRLVSSYQYE